MEGGTTEKPREAKVVSLEYSISNIWYLYLGIIREHYGLKPISLKNDAIPINPILDGVMVLSRNKVVVALNTNEHEPSYKDEDAVGLEEDGYAQIYSIITCWQGESIILCITIYISLWIQKEIYHFFMNIQCLTHKQILFEVI